MLLRDGATGLWLSPILTTLPWLEHGFGGRTSCNWPPPHASALKQVHGNHVLSATAPGACGEGDALVTHTPGLWVGIRTADCVPILLADARQRRVAAVHAGWRGTVAEVAVQALAQMGSQPADVTAALGPAIGACCYEVGPDVAAHFTTTRPGPRGRPHLDLIAANRHQLLRAGLPPTQIDAAPPCTQCGDDFHSYRRDGEHAGRMVAAIRIR